MRAKIGSGFVLKLVAASCLNWLRFLAKIGCSCSFVLKLVAVSC